MINIDDDVSLDGTPVMHKSVADYLGDEYKPLKELYLTKHQKELAFQNHLKTFEKSADKQKVNDYKDACEVWSLYKRNHDMTDPANISEAETLERAYTNKPLPEGADPKIIEAAVKSDGHFQKYLTAKIDPLDPSPKCVANSKCDAQNLKEITTQYLKADVEYDEAVA